MLNSAYKIAFGMIASWAFLKERHGWQPSLLWAEKRRGKEW